MHLTRRHLLTLAPCAIALPAIALAQQSPDTLRVAAARKVMNEMALPKMDLRLKMKQAALATGDPFTSTTQQFIATHELVRTGRKGLRAMATTDEQKKAINEWAIAEEAAIDSMLDARDLDVSPRAKAARDAAYQRVLFAFEDD